MKQTLRLRLFAAACIVLVAMTACGKDEGPAPAPAPAKNSIDVKMDGYLKSHYLWNEEYVTLKPDFSLEYDEFLSKTLLSMTTNIYDKKLRNGEYRLYSYIERKSQAAASVQWTRGVNHGQAKEAQMGFGFVQMALFTFEGTEDYGMAVSAVYPGSPADKAGIKRGFEIMEIDGQPITDDNLYAMYEMLMRPGAVKTIVLTENMQGLPTKTITSTDFYPNPVLSASGLVVNNNKIGYLVYSGFRMAYDDELLAAIASLKNTGVTDLILDLRLNTGGQVPAAQMLSTCIAGSASQGKVFQYYRYNNARMADPVGTSQQTGLTFDSSKNRFYENFIAGNYYNINLQPYWLNMNRLYVLVSESTASASEAVIGSLKGIDIPVTLIGSTTSGKNVGMEPVSLEDGSYEYLFYPITFQGYNAKGETVNYHGITPDYELSDWNNGYLPFGNLSEPLLAKALELISGVAPRPAALSLPTRAMGGVRLADRKLPEIVDGPQGMIQMPRDAAAQQ